MVFDCRNLNVVWFRLNLIYKCSWGLQIPLLQIYPNSMWLLWSLIDFTKVFIFLFTFQSNHLFREYGDFELGRHLSPPPSPNSTCLLYISSSKEQLHKSQIPIKVLEHDCRSAILLTFIVHTLFCFLSLWLAQYQDSKPKSLLPVWSPQRALWFYQACQISMMATIVENLVCEILSWNTTEFLS